MSSSNSEPAFHQTSSSQIALGVFIGILGTTASSLANVLVKLTHEQNMKLEPHLRKPGYKRPMWYLVIFLYVANGVLDFMAYAFAPLSVVAPVAALTIVSNAVLARIFFGELLSRTDIIGSITIIVGAAGAAATGSRQAPDRTLDELIELWRREEWLFFMSAMILLTFFVGAATRMLAPEWTGCGNYLRANCTCCQKQKPRPKSDVAPVTPLGASLVAGVTSPTVVASPTASPATDPAVITAAAETPAGAVAVDVVNPADAGRGIAALAAATVVLHHDNQQANQPATGPVAPAAPVTPVYPHYASWKLPVRACCYAFFGALFGSWTNLLGKSVSELFSAAATGKSDGFAHWEAWLMLIGVGVTAVGQLKVMAEMMAAFEAVLIIPIYQCVFLLWLIICGAVYFDEFRDTPLVNGLIFALCILVSMGGIFVLAGRKVGPKEGKLAGAAASSVSVPSAASAVGEGAANGKDSPYAVIEVGGVKGNTAASSSAAAATHDAGDGSTYTPPPEGAPLAHRTDSGPSLPDMPLRLSTNESSGSSTLSSSQLSPRALAALQKDSPDSTLGTAAAAAASSVSVEMTAIPTPSASA